MMLVHINISKEGFLSTPAMEETAKENKMIREVGPVQH